MKMKNLVLNKTMIIVMAVCFVTSVAMAQNKAETICRKSFLGDDQAACLSRVSGKTFDPEGVKICESFFMPDDQASCLGKIANMNFAPDVIRICKKKFLPEDRLSCILELGTPNNQTGKPQVVIIQEPLMANQPALVNAFDDAAAICQGFYYSSDKSNCMVKIKGGLFNKGAVRICESLYYSSDKLNCLSAIRDVTYSAPALKTCGDKYYASDKLSCLKELSERWPGLVVQPGTTPRPIAPANPPIQEDLQKECGNSEVIEKLTAAKESVRKGRTKRALDLIEESIRMIEATECSVR